MLAAAVLPLSTASSVAEFAGAEAALDDRAGEARLFSGTFVIVTAVGALVVLVPGMPLVPLLVLTQVLNAVLLLPLLVFMTLLARDRALMGAFTAGRRATTAYATAIAVIGACVVALGALALTG
ncbi:MAG: divalent metal cation transporter [Actinomycetota bacterium]